MRDTPIRDVLENVETAGFVLSSEQRAALASSMVTLVKENKMKSCQFWGRIVGTSKDYYIVQLLGDDMLNDRKSFVSLDCMTWAQLPTVHPVIAASAKLIRKRFTGNMGNEFVVTEPGPSKDEAPVDLPEEAVAMRQIDAQDGGNTIITTTIKEEQRIAAVVSVIDNECSIVPYGAYNKLPDGTIGPVSTWGGLTFEDAGKLASYKHFRSPTKAIPPLERAKLNKTLDFWDNLTDDVPHSTWTLTSEAAAKSVLIKSWMWPGFSFFHVPETPSYAAIYNGTGVRNSDIFFMF
mmetsp:Transcript_3769/g.9478  ORF Transcript_3769/g.9478 Transcript_3769/m.9478 type:complete len:292 (+) Transcript_3769:77-952(+)